MIGFQNPKESKNGFCISLLDRSIQDISDHGDQKNRVDSLVPLTHHDLRDLGLFSKETQNPFSDSFRFKNPMLDFLKEMHPKSKLETEWHSPMPSPLAPPGLPFSSQSPSTQA